MKKALLLLAVALATFAENVWADKDFVTLQEKTLGRAVSPDGRYVVGVNPDYSVDGTAAVSFLYDTNTGEIKWLTEFDENDLSKGGEFSDITDKGVICGTSKDPDLLITYTDMFGTETRPANSAAVWKDGKCTLLYYGDFDTSNFKYLGDGSRAMSISSDDKTVCGYISIGNGSTFTPMVWTEDAESNWKGESLAIPEGMKGGRALYISADGSVIAGIVYNANNRSLTAIWKDGQCTLLTDESFTQLHVLGLSPNGRYLLIDNMTRDMYLYDIENMTNRTIPAFDTGGSVSYGAVDNDGNVISAYNYGNPFFGDKVYSRPFWYSYKNDRIFDFTYYMQLFAEGVEPEFTFDYTENSQAIPTCISADGKVIVGNVDTYTMLGQSPKSWILKSEKYEASIPFTPDGLKATSEALGCVTLSWTKDDTSYDDLTLKNYNVYRDGVKVGSVPADNATVFSEENVPFGHPAYSVEAVFDVKNNDNDMVSPKSNVLIVPLPENYNLPLTEDFSSNSLDTNYWMTEYNYGDRVETNWGILKDYGLIGSSISSITYSNTPYSSSLISRPLDATDHQTVSASFLVQTQLVNSTEQDIEKDSLSLDVSTDFGKTWKEVKSWTLSQLADLGYINSVGTDLSNEAAGKVFMLRMRKHGLGIANYSMLIDNLCITADGLGNAAPTGLDGVLSDDGKSVSLIWHNLSGAYQLNYINDMSFTRKYTIGNEGKELIAANLFEKSDLDRYKGKYITGIQTTINYYEDAGDIHASVVVFEGDKLVCEQEIENIEYNKPTTIVLDNPILIDGNSDLKIGVKIFDYSEQQIPICYIISKNFVAGKSDIYSEDNGVTWQKLSDFYNEQGKPEQGYCCWDITGCVTDDPEITPADESGIITYNIYRDGVQLNKSVIDRLQTRFIDTNPSKDACYQVVSYNFDGTSSEASEQFCLDDATGIEHNITDNVTITRNEGDNCLTINGKFDNAVLVDISGVCISRSEGNRLSLNGVKAGIYIISINVDGRVYTQKMIVK